MGLTMKERQAVTGEYKPRYHKATKKGKQALLDEFVRLTGYCRKSAARLPAAPVYIGGRPVKFKPAKKRPTNRKGKRACTGEAIRRLMAGIWHHSRNRGKTLPDKPRRYRPLSQKRQGGAQAQGEKPHQPSASLKSRIPIRTFCIGREAPAASICIP
jgi:hypothetical protein